MRDISVDVELVFVSTPDEQARLMQSGVIDRLFGPNQVFTDKARDDRASQDDLKPGEEVFVASIEEATMLPSMAVLTSNMNTYSH